MRPCSNEGICRLVYGLSPPPPPPWNFRGTQDLFLLMTNIRHLCGIYCKYMTTECFPNVNVSFSYVIVSFR